MKLLDTFIYKGIKRIVIAQPVFKCTRDNYIEFINYGEIIGSQKLQKVYLSELEGGKEGGVETAEKAPITPPPTNIIEWPYGASKDAV